MYALTIDGPLMGSRWLIARGNDFIGTVYYGGWGFEALVGVTQSRVTQSRVAQRAEG